MIERAFKKVFWGHIFLLINIRILGVDILPNFIGYIIILLGLKTLISNSEHFIKAIKYNYPLIILSLISIYQRPMKGQYFRVQELNLIGMVIGVIEGILSLVFMYNLLMGTKEICDKNNMVDLYNRARDLWNHYWKVLVALLIGIPLALIPVVGLIYLLIVVIISIVVNIRILKLFWDTSDKFNIDRVIN